MRVSQHVGNVNSSNEKEDKSPENTKEKDSTERKIHLNEHNRIEKAVVIIEDIEFKWGTRDIKVGLWPFFCKDKTFPVCSISKLTFKFTWDHKNIWRRGERWSLVFYEGGGKVGNLESIVNKDFAAPFRHVSKYPPLNEEEKRGVRVCFSECEMAKQEIDKRSILESTTLDWLDFD